MTSVRGDTDSTDSDSTPRPVLVRRNKRSILAIIIRGLSLRFCTPKNVQKNAEQLRQDIQLLNFHLEHLEGWLSTLEDDGRFISGYTSQDEDCEQICGSNVQGNVRPNRLSVWKHYL